MADVIAKGEADQHSREHGQTMVEAAGPGKVDLFDAVGVGVGDDCVVRRV
jgi:hypothetical protein